MNETNIYKNTPLHYASENYMYLSSDLGDLVTNKKIDINDENTNRDTALMIACRKGNSYIALQLLKIEGIEVNSSCFYGDTSLILSCKNNMKNIALELLKRKDIDVNHIDKYGYTALHHACKNNMSKVALKILKQEGININHKDKDGYTALDYAFSNNMDSVILSTLEKFGSAENTRSYARQFKQTQTLSEECQICLCDKMCDTLLIHADTLSCHIICETCYDRLPETSNQCPYCREKVNYVL